MEGQKHWSEFLPPTEQSDNIAKYLHNCRDAINKLLMCIGFIETLMQFMIEKNYTAEQIAQAKLSAAAHNNDAHSTPG